MFKLNILFLLLFWSGITDVWGYNNDFFCEPEIQQVITADPTDCSVNDGQIEIIAIGTNGNLEYSIDGGLFWQSNPAFTNLPAGAYLIVVRNADGTCPVQYGSPITLAGPDSPRFIEVSSTGPTNCDNNDGTITIFAEGGTGPYQYSIDNGMTWVLDNPITNLAPDTYIVMVRNADATCPTTHVFPIVLNPVLPPVINTVSVISPSDCGLENGLIQIAASGTGSLEYSIDSGISWQTSALFNSLAPGNYTVKARYTNASCEVTYGEVIVPALTPPVIVSVSATNPNDCNESNGIIDIQTTDGMTPHQFSVDGGGSWSFNGHFENLSTGTYQIMVRNENGSCLVIHPELIELVQPPLPLIININTNDNSDCGGSTGSIEIDASGGNPGLEYSINNGVTWQSQPVFSNLASGSYLVQVRNDDGSCAVSHPATITIHEPVLPSIGQVDTSNPTNCGATDGTISIIAFSPEATEFEYSIRRWNNLALKFHLYRTWRRELFYQSKKPGWDL